MMDLSRYPNVYTGVLYVYIVFSRTSRVCFLSDVVYFRVVWNNFDYIISSWAITNETQARNKNNSSKHSTVLLTSKCWQFYSVKSRLFPILRWICFIEKLTLQLTPLPEIGRIYVIAYLLTYWTIYYFYVPSV